MSLMWMRFLEGLCLWQSIIQGAVKPANCLSPEMTIRTGWKAWKGTLKFKKQTWSSLKKYTFLFLKPGTYYLTFSERCSIYRALKKIFQNKIRLNLRTLSQHCREESTKVITGSRTHRGREPGQFPFHTGVPRICQF